MLDTTIKDFYNKTGVSVELTLSMSNPDARLTMSLGDGLERYFYINNFLPTTDEEVMNLLTSILEQWIEDIKEYCDKTGTDWTKLRWHRHLDTINKEDYLE